MICFAQEKSNVIVVLPGGYRPSDEEPFMNPIQLEYFKQRLLSWRDQLSQESIETVQHLQHEHQIEPDIIDCASKETDRALELRTRDRKRKLISKIDEALRRIEEGSYGYCKETEGPISLRRLEAKPIAALCIEAQERHERRKKVHKKEW